MKRHQKKTNRFFVLVSREGFTFIELLVAIALFSIVVSIAVGGFVQALRTQRRIIELVSANSNASLAIEQMAREIRTGTGFSCVGAMSVCDELSFTNADNQVVVYRRGNSAPSSGGVLERGIEGSFASMTAPTIDILYLSFALLGSSSYPERITVSLGVSVKTPGIEGGSTNIQTTISARQF
ncbi:MAG: prepilin-type N-terminal cleavage/methylation domain-containing protein [Patescibacteria group bacterium]